MKIAESIICFCSVLLEDDIFCKNATVKQQIVWLVAFVAKSSSSNEAS